MVGGYTPGRISAVLGMKKAPRIALIVLGGIAAFGAIFGGQFHFDARYPRWIRPVERLAPNVARSLREALARDDRERIFVVPGALIERGEYRFAFTEGPTRDTTVMTGREDAPVGLFRHQAIVRFTDDRRLLVESMASPSADHSHEDYVSFQLVDVERLRPMEDVDDVIRMYRPGQPIAELNAGPVDVVEVPDWTLTERRTGPGSMAVPQSFREFESVYRFEHYWNSTTDPTTNRATTLWMLVVDFRRGTFEFRPQFWWDVPAPDYDVLAPAWKRERPEPSYLGVFIPTLNRVGGSGSGMRPFLLDEAARELSGWAVPDER